MRQFGDIVGFAERDIDAHQATTTLDEDIVRAIHEHIRDLGVVEERLQRTEAKELRAQRVEVAVGDRRSCGGTDAFTKERAPRGIRIQREQAGRVYARRDLGAYARDQRGVGHARARRSESIARRVAARAANESSAR